MSIKSSKPKYVPSKGDRVRILAADGSYGSGDVIDVDLAFGYALVAGCSDHWTADGSGSDWLPFSRLEEDD